MEKTVANYLVRTTPTATRQSLNTVASALLIAGIVITLLYIGRPILEPLVIAALLAFILTPVIRRLRTWGLWRIPAVVLASLWR
jgi:predicted PurR-regulated permease PerM